LGGKRTATDADIVERSAADQQRNGRAENHAENE
jgi:hypothetical protein